MLIELIKFNLTTPAHPCNVSYLTGLDISLRHIPVAGGRSAQTLHRVA
jgi:hypothetical protein